jgi:hypothetical protein
VPIGKKISKTQQATADLFFDSGVLPEKVDVGKTLDGRYNKTIEARRKAATAASTATTAAG